VGFGPLWAFWARNFVFNGDKTCELECFGGILLEVARVFVKGFVDQIIDNNVILVFEEHNNVTMWFHLKNLPEGVSEGDIVNVEVLDSAAIPSERSIEEPYESDGKFRGVSIDYKERQRREVEIKRLLHKLHHGW